MVQGRRFPRQAMKTSPTFSLAFTLSVLQVVAAYTWPNPQLDELDSQRYDRVGYNARRATASVKPCDRFDFGVSGGRSNAADWIRTVSTAYLCRIFLQAECFCHHRHTMTWRPLMPQQGLAVWMALCGWKGIDLRYAAKRAAISIPGR